MFLRCAGVRIRLPNTLPFLTFVDRYNDAAKFLGTEGLFFTHRSLPSRAPFSGEAVALDRRVYVRRFRQWFDWPLRSLGFELRLRSVRRTKAQQEACNDSTAHFQHDPSGHYVLP